MKYLYSSETASRNRGGTEFIETLLIDNHKYTKISEVEIKNIVGEILLINVSFKTVITFMLKYSNQFIHLKTATYSYRRFILEYIFSFIFYKRLKTQVISKWQSKYYFKSTYFNLFSSMMEYLSVNITDKDRKYRFGYVGRIDKHKGYFEAKDLILRLSKNHKCVMDILLWNDGLKKYLPPTSNTLDIIIGNKSKSKPIYNQIECLILPYQSLSSTIAIPIVVIEACICGCKVYVTKNILKLLSNEIPVIKKYIFDIEEIRSI